MAFDVTDFPQPDSPDDCESFSFMKVERHASNSLYTSPICCDMTHVNYLQKYHFIGNVFLFFRICCVYRGRHLSIAHHLLVVFLSPIHRLIKLMFIQMCHPLNFGSSASCSPSPRTLNANIVNEIKNAGKNRRHQ